ncbi:MAG: winged helix-turn-helix transcriptional regulator [Actinomycetota bacterium]
MSGYGQHCPVAKAAEILDGRWTILVLRELVVGRTRFNQIHRGVPRMSRTLLSRRLRELQREGIVRRSEDSDGPVYTLTPAGEEILPVLEAVGEWGVRWLGSLSDEDLDPAVLLWEMQRSVDAAALPPGCTVLALTFPDQVPELRRWWLLLSGDDVEVCDEDPGLEVDVSIETPLRVFIRVWRGDVGWDDALRAGEMRVGGPEHLRRGVRSWFHLSHFATVPRPS